MNLSDHQRHPNNAPGIIIIPARLQSRRLSRKLLLDSTGRPLLTYTIQQAQLAVAASCGLFREVIVACDHSQLFELAQKAGVRAVLTSDAHSNGTSRITEAILKISLSEDISFVLNLQGDQPELQPEAMIQVGTDLIRHPQCDMVTAAVEYPASDAALFANPSVVKVAFDSCGYATDFYRHPAPANISLHTAEPTAWYRHVGIYAYRTDFLHRYVAAPQSTREQQESLEQLRALEMGAMIRVSLITMDQAGGEIDTSDDYADFVERMRHRQAASP